jgi:hypothetical protein
MNELEEVFNAEKHYRVCFDSVNMIDSVIDGNSFFDTQEEKNDCVRRNVEHLKYMTKKLSSENFDLEKLYNAISKGEEYLSLNNL